MNSRINELKEKIDENKIISFDIFDTLVLRNVLKPKDIFKVVEIIIAEKFRIKGFAKARIEAENKARIFSRKEDITLEEIYNNLDKKFEEHLDEIKKIELETEQKFIIANPFIKEAYDYAIEKGKEIYIISDMYLPKKFLVETLNKIGYKGFKELYVSGEINKTKGSGSAYDFVKKENKIKDTSKWLHVGDNNISDIMSAKNKGLNTYFYEPPYTKISQKNMPLKESIMYAVQYNQTRNGLEVETFNKIGIECVSSIFYGFCDWLARLTKAQDNLIFLSRDGYFPIKVFDLMKEKRGLDIYTKYLLTSRKAYQVPAYALMPKKDVIEQLTLWNSQLGHTITIKDVYKQVGIDAKDFIEEIHSFGFKDENVVLDFANREKVKKLVALTYGKIKETLEGRLELVKEYLKEEKMDTFKQLNIVDIGWRGSIHNAMQKILPNDVIGFYFGTNEYVYDEIKLNTFGYYFDLGFPIENKQYTIDNIMMFELIFNSPEQSLLRFDKDKNGKIVPVFSDKKNTYGEKLDIMQKAALETIKKLLVYDEYITEISIKSCMKNYIDFINKKEYEHRVAFSEFTNEIGMDDADYGYVLKVSKEEFLKNPNAIMEKAKFSLWKDTFIIEGINTEKEFKKFLKDNNLKEKKHANKFGHTMNYVYMVTKLPNYICRKTKNVIKKMTNRSGDK